LRRNISYKQRAIARSLVHACLGSSFAVALRSFPREGVISVAAGLTALFLLAELVSFVVPGWRRWLCHQLVLFLRPEEDNAVTGATYFLIGITSTIAVFPTGIASLAVLFLAFGDPVAAAIGRWKGRTTMWRKNLEGHLACLTICLLLAAIMAGATHRPGWVAGTAGALAATLAQAPPWHFNDNLTIPIGSATVMLLVGWWLGVPV
jgi:dolichol kinase